MGGREFRNTSDWLTPFLAQAVWAAHFSLLWAASSIFPGEPTARWLAAAITVVAAGALLVLWRRAKIRSPFDIAGLGIGIASAGVLFGFAPALIG